MGGVVNKVEALVRDVHCYTDKVVKEEVFICRNGHRTESIYLWHSVCSGQGLHRQVAAI